MENKRKKRATRPKSASRESPKPARQIPSVPKLSSSIKESWNESGYSIPQVQEHLRIDPEDIMNEYMNQPGLYAWYSTLKVEAEAIEDRAKYSLEQVEAEVLLSVKERLQYEQGKFTEKEVMARVRMDSKYQEKREELLEASRDAKMLKSIEIGLVHKKDMLVSLGATLRKESESYISIKQNS